MIVKTQFFKSFIFDKLYTMEEIGEALGKNRHYVSSLFSKNGIKEDDKQGKNKMYWGYTIQKLTDEGVFDQYFVRPPMTPKPTNPYMPRNFELV
jgi:hypothetical protein